MSTKKLCYTIILVIIFLLIAVTSTLAADSAHLLEISHTSYDPSQFQLDILVKLISDFNPTLSHAEKRIVCNSIITDANLTGFDPLFISSIIAAESSFDPNAVSPCAALGLMQLTACVSTAMHISNPFNIQENIYAGTRFLKDLKTRFLNTNLILAAYNAGPTLVASLGRVPRFKETLCYIKTVNSLYYSLKQQMYSLIKDKLSNPVLGWPVAANRKGNTPLKPSLLKQAAPAVQGFFATDFLCETDPSIRFIFNT